MRSFKLFGRNKMVDIKIKHLLESYPQYSHLQVHFTVCLKLSVFHTHPASCKSLPSAVSDWLLLAAHEAAHVSASSASP